jgi:hypothetical protein
MRAWFWGALAALALGACAPVHHDDSAPDQWAAIDVETKPVELGAARIGDLVFRGGLELTSEFGWFGGISGMEVLDGDHFVMISDRGDWFDGRLVFDESGQLVGVDDMRTAPMRDENAEPYNTRAEGDSEDLTQLPDGRFVVSFEQHPRLMIYDLNRDGPFGAAAAGPPLAEADRLPPNVSLEALASTESGDLIIGAEGGGGPTPIWRVQLGATTPTPPVAQYRLHDGYSLTSLDRLPDGRFVALERFYAPVVGARARISTFDASALSEGGMIEPHRLAEIAPPLAVDNFEAIAAVRMPNGVTRLYVMSDDNFSDRQRTLLLAFDWAE